VAEEVLAALRAEGAVTAPQRFTTPAVGVRPRSLKRILDKLCAAAGVAVRLDTQIIAAHRDEGRIASLQVVDHAGVHELTVHAFDDTSTLSTPHQWFTLVRLLGSHLTPSRAPFPRRSPPTALNRSSSRWFEISPCRAIPEGPPPSPTQHRIQRPRPSTSQPPSTFVAHKHRRVAKACESSLHNPRSSTGQLARRLGRAGGLAG
jgi:hypothetical protein